MFFWNKSVEWSFNTRNAYKMYLATIQPPTNHSNCNWVWEIKAINKMLIKFFMWLLISNKLPTSTELYKRNISIVRNCSTCPNSEENTDHIFLHCPNAKHIWEALHIKPPEQDLLSRVQQLCTSAANKTIDNRHLVPNAILVPDILWNIWKNRNNNLFKKKYHQ